MEERRKKPYMAPKSDVRQIKLNHIIAFSNRFTFCSIDYDGGDAQAESNSRRGTWGDLWAEGEEE